MQIANTIGELSATKLIDVLAIKFTLGQTKTQIDVNHMQHMCLIKQAFLVTFCKNFWKNL